MNNDRGERNCNPGNIRHSSITWQGEAEDQTDDQFVTFAAPEWGIRAIAKILETYQSEDGCKTIRQLITRWAPPNENDTTAYVDNVADAAGVSPDTPVTVTTYAVMNALVKAIIHQENGEQPYSQALIDQGLALAGVRA